MTSGVRRWENSYIQENGFFYLIIKDLNGEVSDSRIKVDRDIINTLRQHTWRFRRNGNHKLTVSSKICGKECCLPRYVSKLYGLDIKDSKISMLRYSKGDLNLTRGAFSKFIDRGYRVLPPFLTKHMGYECYQVIFFEDGVERYKSFNICKKRSKEQALEQAKEFIENKKLEFIFK